MMLKRFALGSPNQQSHNHSRAMRTVTDLARWEVPFAEARDPSVSLITERGGDAAMLVVAPMGIDRYPKYLVRFDRVLVSLCYEETVSLDRDYRSLTGIEPSVCAYVWTGSPWLRASSGTAELHELLAVQHYLVFGGDSIVELIASGQPKVERLDSHRVIEARHEV
jgi:hypothetical protein